MMNKPIQEMQSFCMKCYQRMSLTNIVEDYSVQEYAMARTDATNEAEQLLDYIDTHDKEMAPEESADLLLAVFIALNTSFRNTALFCRATDTAEHLLPLLPESRVRTHLLIYFYLEKGDERIQEEIGRLKGMADSEEDRCFMNLYERMSEQCFV